MYLSSKVYNILFEVTAMPRSRYIRSCYLMSKSIADNGHFSWACNIKMLLYQLGFRNVWTEQGSVMRIHLY